MTKRCLATQISETYLQGEGHYQTCRGSREVRERGSTHTQRGKLSQRAETSILKKGRAKTPSGICMYPCCTRSGLDTNQMHVLMRNAVIDNKLVDFQPAPRLAGYRYSVGR